MYCTQVDVHVCIIYKRSYKRDHYVFYEHADTRISSLSYIKLKCLDNDILTKSISKTCTNYETKGKPRKKLHIPVSNPHLNKNLVCMERNSLTPKPLGHSSVDLKGVVLGTRESDKLVASKNDEKFCKITKICLLETK